MPIAQPHDSVRLRVRRLDVDAPLIARARVDDGRWEDTDADGVLVLPLQHSRSLELQVRAVGFGPADLRIRPAPDSGLQVLAVMAPMWLHIVENCR